MASALVRKLQVFTYFRDRGPAFSPTIHHVLPPKRWEAMTKRRSFMPSSSRSAAARGPCASSCLWRLPRPPLESPPGGRNDLPGWRSTSGARSAVKSGRSPSQGTRGAERLDGRSGGRSYLGGPEDELGGSGCLAPHGSRLGSVKRHRNK